MNYSSFIDEYKKFNILNKFDFDKNSNPVFTYIRRNTLCSNVFLRM